MSEKLQQRSDMEYYARRSQVYTMQDKIMLAWSPLGIKFCIRLAQIPCLNTLRNNGSHLHPKLSQ